jgi:hypothetical protein
MKMVKAGFVRLADIDGVFSASIWMRVQRKSGMSPYQTSSFYAACARGTENAATEKSSALPRGGKPAIHAMRSRTNPANSQTAGQNVNSLRLSRWRQFPFYVC